MDQGDRIKRRNQELFNSRRHQYLVEDNTANNRPISNAQRVPGFKLWDAVARTSERDDGRTVLYVHVVLARWGFGRRYLCKGT